MKGRITRKAEMRKKGKKEERGRGGRRAVWRVRKKMKEKEREGEREGRRDGEKRRQGKRRKRKLGE